MVKEKINNWFVNIWSGIKSHPVELVVLLHLAAVLIANTESAHAGWWDKPAPYGIFAFVAALCLSFYRDRRWVKIVYWLILPIYALCVFLPEGWPPEIHVLYAIVPLVYLLARGKYTTDGFRGLAFGAVRSFVIAIGIGGLVELLLGLIYLSICALFDVSGERPVEIFSIIVAALLIPILFIGMESGRRELIPSRLEGVLVNYVLMPAVMIYNLVLYIYLAMIAIRWDLPKGSVAVMVTVYMFMLVLVGWLRQPLKKQPLKWYFRWSGLFALPLVVLFWVAVGYRVGQYGLTIDRCLLVGIGVVMVVYVVFSLLRPRKISYDAIFAGVIVLLGMVLALGGPLSARQFSKRSQMALLRQSAEKIGILTEEGTLNIAAPNDSDSLYRTEHRTIYQALKYIDNDLKCDVKAKFAMSDEEYLDKLSTNTARYVQKRVADDGKVELEPDVDLWDEGSEISVSNDYAPMELIDIGGYNRLYTNISIEDYKLEDFGAAAIDLDSVLATQLASVGLSRNSTLKWGDFNDCSGEFCTYRSPDGQMIIIFDYLNIIQTSKGNRIESGRIGFLLLK